MHRSEISRDEDGSYGHQTIGSPLTIRIVAIRAGVLTALDGGDRR